MGEKVTFDPINRKVIVHKTPILENGEYVIDLDIQADLYSDGKEDWVSNESLRKLKFPIRAVGGDPLPGSKVLGDTYFIASDWKISPYEQSHRFRVNGNFYSEDGTSPFDKTSGSFNLFLEQTVSSLVDSTVAQLAEIEYASYNGGVSVDVTSGFVGTDYPLGTPQQPIDNFSDALSIAAERGFVNFYINGDATIDTGLNYTDKVFYGQGQNLSSFIVSSTANVLNCTFFDASISGILDGDSHVEDCIIDGLIYVNGVIERCLLTKEVITLGGNKTAHFVNCQSAVEGGDESPIINMGGSGQGLTMSNYNGGVRFRNKTGPEKVSLNLNSATVTLENTVTNGAFVVRGDGKIVDENGNRILTGTWNGGVEIDNQTSAEESKQVLLSTESFP